MKIIVKFTLVFSFLMLLASLSPAALPQSRAATEPSDKLYVEFPGVTTYKETPANYINTIYRWSIGLAALLAMAQIVFGGILYVLAAGSLYSQEEAKEKIKNAAVGLLLLLAIALILREINPTLTILNEKIVPTDI